MSQHVPVNHTTFTATRRNRVAVVVFEARRPTGRLSAGVGNTCAPRPPVHSCLGREQRSLSLALGRAGCSSRSSLAAQYAYPKGTWGILSQWREGGHEGGGGERESEDDTEEARGKSVERERTHAKKREAVK